MQRARVAALLAALVTIVSMVGVVPARAGTSFWGNLPGDAWVRQPDDVALDNAGNVYIASEANDRVLVLDPNGADVRTYAVTAAPTSVVPTPSGDLVYNTDVAFTGQVFSYDSSGHSVSTEPSGLTGANGLAIGDPASHLYVGSSDGSVYVVDQATHTFTQLFNIDGPDPGFAGPQDVAIDAAGHLYIADTGKNRVVAYTSTGTTQTYVGEWSTGASSSPKGIAIDANGNVLVSETGLNSIQRYSPAGVPMGGPIGGSGGSPGELMDPRGIAVDATGRILVADRGNDRVQRFTAAGAFDAMVTGGSTNNDFPEFATPVTANTDDQNNLYVVEKGRQQVEKFDANGKFVRAFGAGTFTSAWGVAVRNSDHSVYVTDELNTNSVTRFNGVTGAQIGPQDTGATLSPPGYSFPRGLAFNQTTDRLYVVDRGTSRIIRENADFSSPVVIASGTGSLPAQFNGVNGIAIDRSTGNLFVTDEANHRVQELDPNGAFIREWGTPGSGPGQFEQATGIAVEPNGNVLVADTATDDSGLNDRVERFAVPADPSKAAVLIDTIGAQDVDNQAPLGGLHRPTGVAMDDRGNGYIVDGGHNRVQRFGISGGLTPITPTRILDTRSGVGLSGAFAPGQTRDLDVTNTLGSGVPAQGVDAVILNVTATGPSANGWLTLFPTGATLPTASNLNFGAGQTVPNLVVVKVGPAGTVSINNTGGNPSAGTVHVIADVVGWYGDGSDRAVNESASEFVGVPPVRILDTRTGTGAPAGPIGPNGTVPLDVGAVLPAECLGATTAVLNVTATAPSQGGWLTVYPADATLPNASNLNFLAGQTVPNLVTVKLGVGVGNANKVKITNTDVPTPPHPASGTVHAIADLAGCYKPVAPGTGYLTSITAQRILDTRFGTGVVGGSHNPLGPNATITVDPQTASPNVPAAGGYRGVIVNITATGPTQGGWLTAYPSDASLPNASNLNFVAGQTVPNLVKIKVGPDGKFKITNTDVPTLPHPASGTVHVIVDIVGWYQ